MKFTISINQTTPNQATHQKSSFEAVLLNGEAKLHSPDIKFCAAQSRRYNPQQETKKLFDQPPLTVPVVKLRFAAPLGQPLHFVEAEAERSEVAGLASGAGVR